MYLPLLLTQEQARGNSSRNTVHFSVQLKPRLHISSQLVCQTLESSFQSTYTKNMLSLQVMLHLTPRVFCFERKNTSFCHQTEDLQSHNSFVPQPVKRL